MKNITVLMTKDDIDTLNIITGASTKGTILIGDTLQKIYYKTKQINQSNHQRLYKGVLIIC